MQTLQRSSSTCGALNRSQMEMRRRGKRKRSSAWRATATTANRLRQLRGQQFDYLVTKLKEYREGKLTRSSNDFIVTGVARTIDDELIQAVGRG
jgi:hypothetical protein